MGWFSDCFSAVCDFVSDVASSVGSALASAATSLVNIAGSWLGSVANTIGNVAKMLGAFQKEDTPEDLGRRATLSDQKPEDFDSIEAYIDHLKSDIQVDKEKIKLEEKSDKMAYQAIGATIGMKAIEEKKGFEIPMKTWVTFAKLGMENKESEVNALLDNFKGDVGQLTEYAEGKLDAKKEMEVGDKMAETYKTLEPELSEAAIEKKVMEMEISGNQR